jgi:energy-coupling factor transporter ATP-binding protein EcfA2
MEHITQQLQQIQPQIQINTVELEDGHNLNSLWLAYSTEGVTELINGYDKKLNQTDQLKIVNDQKIQFVGKAGIYYVTGRLSNDLGSMKVSLTIEPVHSGKKCRIKTDLFDFGNVNYQCNLLTEKEGFDFNLLEADLIALGDLLEDYRDAQIEAEDNPITDRYSERELTPRAEEKAVEFLSNPRLMGNIDKLLEQSGITGEEINRIITYIIATSYKSHYPLQGMVQGTSGSGKSHLVNSIAQCIPQEDIKDWTRVTPKALYNYGEKDLTDKLIIIQDFDGLEDKAQYAFREIQSNKRLGSSTVGKDKLGNIKSKEKEVKAHFSSLVATTRGEVYLDNASRSIILGIDEAHDQTQRIIKRQNQKRAGRIDIEAEHEAKQLLRNCTRVLKKCHVVNPYADKIDLPVDAKMLRRLNEQYQDFICQITLLHQYQRKTDDKGRLISTKEDVKLATEIFFNAIIIKVDELDGSSRQFFESLKSYIETQPTGKTFKFTQREVRQHTNMGRATVHGYFKMLQDLEYIQCVEGSANTGYKYVITFWDNMEKLKARIKQELNQQLEIL